MELLHSEAAMIVAAIVALGFKAYTLRRKLATARRKLGGDVVEFDQYRRWMVVAHWTFVALAMMLPVGALVFGQIHDRELAETLVDMTRGIYPAALAIALSRPGKVLVGSGGVTAAGLAVIEWKNVRGVKWDRDIGQRSWGATVEVMQGKSLVKQRIYIARDLKPRVEAAIADAIERHEETRRLELEAAQSRESKPEEGRLSIWGAPVRGE